ncbi:peptidase family M48-domain-containing protein [Lipomyces japonicus]|uniref:peptidase family M48-domain-containing protein n=1 Tax=Lipomyces japonicus TaxID=56871 RepID=UPI0034CDB26C
MNQSIIRTSRTGIALLRNKLSTQKSFTSRHNLHHHQHQAAKYATYRRFGSDQATYSPPYNVVGTLLNVLVYNPTARRATIGVIAGGVFFYVWNLDEVPISHRWRFMIMPQSWENKLGEYQYRQLLHEFKNSLLPDHDSRVVHVKNVMHRLIAVSGLPELDWQIHVVSDPRQPPNAFVLPSGKVFVFASILPIAQNENGLATVLAHETAHQVARHSGEKLSKSPIYSLISLAVYLATGSARAIDLMVNLLFEMPASRAMESEADHIGLIMMSQACFQPDEAVRFWHRMEQASKRMMKPMEFLSTHPSDETRVTQIQDWLPEAQSARASSDCDNGIDAHFNNFFGRPVRSNIF